MLHWSRVEHNLSGVKNPLITYKSVKSKGNMFCTCCSLLDAGITEVLDSG